MTFHNLVFQDCDLSSNNQSAIIGVGSCKKNKVEGSIQLHGIQFTNNSLIGGRGIFVQNTLCATIKMNDIAFVQNTCSGTCLAHLGPSNELHNVTVIQNKLAEEEDAFYTNILFLPPGSTMIASGLRAEDNKVTVVEVKEASLTLFKSRFSRTFGGSAVRIVHSEASFIGLMCSSNSGIVKGGCLFSKSTNLSLSESIIQNNTATKGGGIYISDSTNLVVDNTLFSRNEGNDIAGAIYVNGSSVTVVGSQFHGNKSKFKAGAVFLIHSNEESSFQNCSFKNNFSNNGGSLASHNSTITIYKSSLSQDHAAITGGSVYVELSTIGIYHSKFNESKAHYGGGIHSVSSSFQMTDTIMTFCTAQKGAAIHVVNDGSMFLQRCVLSHNNATDDGGALFASTYRENIDSDDTSDHSLHSTKQVNDRFALRTRTIRIIDSNVTNNTARWYGGGMAIFRYKFTVKRSFFARNEGNLGGSLCLSSLETKVQFTNFEDDIGRGNGGSITVWHNGSLTLEHSVIRRSQSTNGGCIFVNDEGRLVAENVTLLQCNATEHGGGIFAKQLSKVYVKNSIFSNNTADRGGAFQAYCDISSNRAYQFDNVLFEMNNASLGGKPAVKSVWNCLKGAIHFKSEEYGKDCSSIKENCSFLVLIGCQFVKNNASVGGAIFAAYPKVIRYRCSPIEERRPLKPYGHAMLASLKGLNSSNVPCKSWKGNRAAYFGKFVASYPRGIRIYRWTGKTRKEISEKELSIHHYTSGRPFHEIEIHLVDEFGQGPAYGTENDTTTARMESKDLLGEKGFPTYFIDGKGSFAGVRGAGKSGTYTVTITFSVPYFKSLTFEVAIPFCSFGHRETKNGTFCKACSREEYNFYPKEKECQGCVKHADCSKRVIHPLSGYFNWSPCSTKVQRCFSKDACDYKLRLDKLYNVTKNVRNCSIVDIKKYHEAECNKARFAYFGKQFLF